MDNETLGPSSLFYRTPRLSNTYNQFGLEHRLLKRCFRYAHVSTEACAHVSYKRPPFRINREVNTTRIEIPVVVTPDIDASSTFSNSIDKTNLSFYINQHLFFSSSFLIIPEKNSNNDPSWYRSVFTRFANNSCAIRFRWDSIIMHTCNLRRKSWEARLFSFSASINGGENREKENCTRVLGCISMRGKGKCGRVAASRRGRRLWSSTRGIRDLSNYRLERA